MKFGVALFFIHDDLTGTSMHLALMSFHGMMN